MKMVRWLEGFFHAVCADSVEREDGAQRYGVPVRYRKASASSDDLIIFIVLIKWDCWGMDDSVSTIPSVIPDRLTIKQCAHHLGIPL